ncbi:MAG: UDP-N-acetylmuramoyl-L-alanine--D-glutamate ligase [Gammaproteobacteria bacterium]|nr:UDP-N-acetylmuramoyl-L-alanine--D-glutamate ligase [Gammaproteobacteria bacterium]MYF57943.1 UDP-N-acetylmuramoyl-L-alanine--D-glutamate ligase [Gammaproteobacteria bacterium]MYH34170.1 UDP-N-acetylmuramoyl-L-alanine--D-glutamate ligase [Gammaproteobacteria bacterium]MYL00270.1 UDP-N-acetylmuramoyl-L-alanine--D-glutamate ligase [Gammaproteobacteria bacterium]
MGETLVFGMGATGASCARYFARTGRPAAFCDTRARPPAESEISGAMPEAARHANDGLRELPEEVDRLLLSPGAPLDHRLVRQARERGMPVVSDLDVFAGVNRARLAGITGSNGKSTVATLLLNMLREAGLKAGAGANLGTPALDLLTERHEVCVLELSSFQLERSAPIALEAAVILNITPDHLDAHASLEEYAAAKARIYLSCKHAVAPADEPSVQALAPPPHTCPRLDYGLGRPAAARLGIIGRGPQAEICHAKTPLMRVGDSAMQRGFQLSNLLAALAVGRVLGVNPAAMRRAAANYQGLPHRMQPLGEWAGLRWINDSKATNAAAAAAAVRTVPDPLVLIAGGAGKGLSYGALRDALKGRDARVIAFGQEADRIVRAVGADCTVSRSDTLDEAVTAARELARPGSTVLLAPACASFDMFSNYRERGRAFERAVRSIQ